jgi:hypothetical protein
MKRSRSGVRQVIAGGLSTFAGVAALAVSLVSFSGPASAADGGHQAHGGTCTKPAGAHPQRASGRAACGHDERDNHHSAGPKGSADSQDSVDPKGSADPNGGADNGDDEGGEQTGRAGPTTTADPPPTTTTVAPPTTTTAPPPTTTTTAPPPTGQQISQSVVIAGATLSVRSMVCPAGMIATNGTAASQTTPGSGETVPAVTATADDGTTQSWTYQLSNPNTRMWSFLLTVTCT